MDDIIEELNKIKRYTNDMDFSKFKENELVILINKAHGCPLHVYKFY
ncbi:MAG: hypothetical protein ACFFAN_13075 [Promethearchaeota archaeon]